MNVERAVAPRRDESAPDPGSWLDRHGEYLSRYARLRDDALAEDAVREMLLAAPQAYASFAGRGSERTRLTGILKHKIVDHSRRAARESRADEGEGLEPEHLFVPDGEWAGQRVAVLVPEKAHPGPNEWARHRA